MTDEVAEIKATEAKEVAVIEAEQASSAEEASQFMETLDKLQEFKRYSIALLLIFVFGLAVFILGAGVLLLMYRGSYDVAVEASKWMITVLGTIVGTIVGFYFGSNVTPSKPS